MEVSAEELSGCHSRLGRPSLLLENGSVNQTGTPVATFEALRGRLFGLAYRMLGSRADAEDVVQDAYVRALRFFSSLRSDDARAWLFTIVRNTWYGRFPQATGANQPTVYDDVKHDRPDEGLDPEALAMQQQAVEKVKRAVQELPTDFREVIILRELEGLSYKEIAVVVGIPIGTVMSRLARARERLQAILGPSVTPLEEPS